MTFKVLLQVIKRRKKVIAIHFGVWMLFIFYELFYLYLLGNKLAGFFDYLLPYLTNAILFYANVWCLSYSFVRKKKMYLYVILIVLEFSVYMLLHILDDEVLSNWKVPILLYTSKTVLIRGIWRAVYFVGLSAAYWFSLQYLKSNNMLNRMQNRQLIQQKKSIEMERNLFRAQNAYLTSQINPHLLFNTLNFIYSNLYEVSEKAAETVLLLSDMMRYSLTEIGEDGKVELLQEIEHIDNMIQLNQARFDDKLQIKIFLDGDFHVRIIPLVLLTFIENIFKHGDLSDPASPAKIHISYHNHTLQYYTINKIRKVNINKGTGIGIENSKTRLSIAYPNRYKLNSKIVDHQYITELTIRFNKSAADII